MTIKEYGLSDAVLESLAQCFSRKTSDIKVQFLSFIDLNVFSTSAISQLF
jgi:hypothetical protein